MLWFDCSRFKCPCFDCRLAFIVVVVDVGWLSNSPVVAVDIVCFSQSPVVVVLGFVCFFG